jgi:WD40 repeat protein
MTLTSYISAVIPRGAKCFDFSPSNAAIVTGGGDRILRVWLRGNYSEPTGRMKVNFTLIGTEDFATK